ncbi:MAG: YlxR family protein [Lachnospiraceae bacterium]|jgi:predicted RNA-binding protein YlxR (DUF448 family)|nr:YlxR family protein [Lachnospiraceae bacterium]MBQ4275485.1 YlxR family protein [Lachnospiraceae bacterium]MCR4696234.1 YlxR family protein [Lachnospiraceae bacterium]
MQNKKTPIRTCISCRETSEKKELVRIVRTPEGEIVLDMTGKRNGRGAYVCKNRDCVEKLRKNHALDRSFKMTVPEEFFDNALKELFSD